jgi:hypothetical protein
MKIYRLLLYCFIIISKVLSSQPYIEGGKTRHRFAQLNVGMDQRFFSPSSTKKTVINSNGTFNNVKLDSHLETRLLIGGTHFWGHSDFFIAISLISSKKSGLKTGVETGIKIFPYRIKNNKIRPFVGLSWMPCSYKQGDGTELTKSKFPITSGLVFNKKSSLFELGIGYINNNAYNYYISEDKLSKTFIHPLWISLSCKVMIETTLSAEKDWQSGRTKRLTDTLAVLKRLNGFTFALGFSSSFFLKTSYHNSIVAPYAGNHKSSIVFPEFGLGYYLHKSDLQINLAYRSVNSSIKAFDFNQKLGRKSITLELYKFLTDYHGFAPFAGLSASYERLNVLEQKQNVSIEANKIGVYPGFTVGWDIRPNRIQTWYLRTNLRYFPNLKVKMPSSHAINFDQLEFNFIQFVLLPERLF